MALVPYVENSLPVLSKLHNSSAQFRFVNRDLQLAQDWKRLGVAAVVWDAVSVVCLDVAYYSGVSARIRQCAFVDRRLSCACTWSWGKWICKGRR